MRMLMQNIINDNRRPHLPRARHYSSNVIFSRSAQSAATNRHHFELNNGYHNLENRRSNTRTEPVIPAPVENSVTVQTPSTILRYNLFQNFIDVSANNLTSELYENNNSIQLQNDNSRYYSTFEYESLSIRFFHNEVLDVQNIDESIESVIDSINNREMQNILNDFQNNEINEITQFTNNTLHNDNTTINDSEVIKKIEENVTHGEYIHYVSVLKNDTCPILLSDFVDDDIVSVFNLCNHAIHQSTYDKYVKTFTKCPLCNNKLFEL